MALYVSKGPLYDSKAPLYGAKVALYGAKAPLYKASCQKCIGAKNARVRDSHSLNHDQPSTDDVDAATKGRRHAASLQVVGNPLQTSPGGGNHWGDGVGDGGGAVAEADGAVAVLTDVDEGARHRLGVLGVSVEERGGGHRGGRQRVVVEVGVELRAEVAVVGMEEGHALVVVAVSVAVLFLGFLVGDDGVGDVPLPQVLVVVDMQDEQSAGGVALVPACGLAVLYHVVLVGPGVVVDDVGLSALVDGLQAVDGDVLVGQHDGHLPSAHHLLVGGIARRTEAAAVVAALVHEVEGAHAVFLAIDRVVEVGEAHAVGELVTEGADAVDAA